MIHYNNHSNKLIKKIPVFVFVKVRSLDVEKAGEDVDEYLPDPGCHLVGLRTSEMNVED